MSDITIAVATYGERQWAQLAQRRAIPSTARFEVPVVAVHGATLHEARNEALAAVRTERVVFLDADDELELGYMGAMRRAPQADIIAPAVRYTRHAQALLPAYVPRVPGHEHECGADCLYAGNWIVIGAAARTSVLREVGGFADWPMFEDWDLWLRCVMAGATTARAPHAVYRAWRRRGSRNRATPERCAEIHSAILRANGLPGLPGWESVGG